MKTSYRKIDIYFNGAYLCSTNQAKTCYEAISKYLENIEKYRRAYNADPYKQILANPKGLRAKFDKSK